MKVLLVGQADSVFFENYVKAAKRNDPSIEFDAFSIEPVNGIHDLSEFASVTVSSWFKHWLHKTRIKPVIAPFAIWITLYRYLKHRSEIYDIIHFKWIVPSVILFPKIINRFSTCTIATFWGQEVTGRKILFSKTIYRHVLDSFLENVTAIVGVSGLRKGLEKYRSKFYYAVYSSVVIEEMISYDADVLRCKARSALGIPKDKISIAIGYSGKELHRHEQVISKLIEDRKFMEESSRFIFILQMNYGGSDAYIRRVEELLVKAGLNYLLIKKGYLSGESIVMLRAATDVMVQLSTSDNLSGSIMESIIAGSILMSGSWLPYNDFHNSHVHFYEVDDINESFPRCLLEIANNISIELELCKLNRIKYVVEGWDTVITKWIYAYKDILPNTTKG